MEDMEDMKVHRPFLGISTAWAVGIEGMGLALVPTVREAGEDGPDQTIDFIAMDGEVGRLHTMPEAQDMALRI